MPTSSLPPYSLARLHFPFPALAAQAGRARLGPEREVALACLMAARLAVVALPESGVPAKTRAERAHAARGWFASLVLPDALHAPVDRLVSASGAEGTSEIATALRALLGAVGRAIDTASRRELEQLVRALKG